MLQQCIHLQALTFVPAVVAGRLHSLASRSALQLMPGERYEARQREVQALAGPLMAALYGGAGAGAAAEAAAGEAGCQWRPQLQGPLIAPQRCSL